MKRRLRLFFIASVFAASPIYRDAVSNLIFADQRNGATTHRSADYIDLYVGSNARWQIDRLRGVVSVWELERPLPLWSRDGVVYRSANSATSYVSTLTPQPTAPATEIFGRVYFFLNDAKGGRAANRSSSFVRRDDLLLALDLRAQGRLVWALRAQDFTCFFAPNASLQFVPRLEILPNDKLLVTVRNERQENQRFIVDAATGIPNPLQ